VLVESNLTRFVKANLTSAYGVDPMFRFIAREVVATAGAELLEAFTTASIGREQFPLGLPQQMSNKTLFSPRKDCVS
jgi:hypothetical protein